MHRGSARLMVDSRSITERARNRACSSQASMPLYVSTIYTYGRSDV